MSDPVTKNPRSMEVVGYSDRLTVQPGQKVRFMVSCTEPAYRADIVRLIHGDANPAGPGFKDQLIVSPVSKSYRGRVQPLRKGSYLLAKSRPALRNLRSFTLQCWIYPTTPKKGRQGIITRWSSRPGRPGYGMLIDKEGRLAVWIRGGDGKDHQVRSDRELAAFNWYFVAATYDGKSGRISLHQAVVADCTLGVVDSFTANTAQAALLDASSSSSSAADLYVGAICEDGQVVSHFNGKIDGPRLYSRALSSAELRTLAQGTAVNAARLKGLVAAWDFARNTQSVVVRDTSRSGMTGRLVNSPTRAVTGWNWSGHEIDFKRAPGEYNAIYFHDDDLGDAGWAADFEYTVPLETRSGVYAAWLRTDASEDYVPFVVRPKKGKPTAKICFLLPTLSYLAYANEHVMVDPDVRRAMGLGDTPYPTQRQDVFIIDNSLLSLYDHHTDGSGVCYTSRLRPILTMRPKYVMQSIASGKGSPHQFNADMHLVDWLEAKGYQFDVITDEDLHDEGLGLLSPYKVVLTGSHPEYWTEQMLSAMQAYLKEGGRLMYLGGNGFYWVTTVSPESRHLFEVRRWGGTGSWMAAPGEYYNSSTGELGGIWRNRGRHPQKMLGIGFTAQGFDVSRPYWRQDGSRDRRASFIFEGIGKDELVGDFPSLVQGPGAAGFELDRLDYSLGTPVHALLLATANGFSDSYQHVIEENTLTDNKQGGTTHPLVKADMVYLKYPKNGGVFSVGSITWCGSLSYNAYDNNVSRLTANVLTKFAGDEELP